MLIQGEFRSANQREYEKIARAIMRRRKDAVLNIRVNRQDLEGIKQKARRSGVPYQSFISELIHHIALS